MIKNILMEHRYDNGVRIDVAKVVLSNDVINGLKNALQARNELQDYDLDFPFEVSAILTKKVKTAEELNVELIVEKEQNKALMDENKALLDRMQGLVPPPAQGAAWDEKKSYINGDVVKDGSDYYKALKYSRGKKPSSSLEHWAKHSAEAVQPVSWDSIETGANVQLGTIVTHGGKRWKCKKAHVKKNVNKPAQISDYWQEMT